MSITFSVSNNTIGRGDALVSDKAIDYSNSFGDEGVPAPGINLCGRCRAYRPWLLHPSSSHQSGWR